MIEEIVKEHKSGNLAYHVALDRMVEEGMEQLEAHELLFPPIGEDDFDPQIPFDPTDIMTIDITPRTPLPEVKGSGGCKSEGVEEE